MNYWEKRNSERLEWVAGQEDKLLKKQRKFYQQAYKDLDNKIQRLYSDLMRQEAPLRYIDLYTYEKYRSLQNQIKQQFRGIAKEQIADIDSMLRLVYWRELKDIAGEFGKDIAFDKISQLQVDAFLTTPYKGKHFSERVWTNTSKIAARIETDISSLLITGENPAKIAEAISKDFGQSYSAAEKLVRTESIHAYNAGTRAGYQRAGVNKYIYYAAEDERTCDLCGALHNKEFSMAEINEGENYPPLHPNCRCTTIPSL
ncbi:MAG: minor capsid protein [Eubacteriales bacterium]|nr:minor capsid protein [Eubacteriales bacterium]